MRKMLVTINDPPYEMLLQMARRRGITVQMMLGSIVIPQWLQDRTDHVPGDLQVNESPAAQDSKGTSRQTL